MSPLLKAENIGRIHKNMCQSAHIGKFVRSGEDVFLASRDLQHPRIAKIAGFTRVDDAGLITAKKETLSRKAEFTIAHKSSNYSHTGPSTAQRQETLKIMRGISEESGVGIVVRLFSA